MKYFLIAGEASGDLHAARLMKALKAKDHQAKFRFIGGDEMSAVSNGRFRHFSTLAYMGFIPVICHLRTILRGMAECRREIETWRPDAVILVDYPGFNMKMARHVARKALCPVYYYIAPKVWAWKEHRVKALRRDVDHLYLILPFETDFFVKKHGLQATYVGNPTRDEIDEYLQTHPLRSPRRGLVALLPGSRQQEIKDNLSRMVKAAQAVDQERQTAHPGQPRLHLVVAAAPSVPRELYENVLRRGGVAANDAEIVYGETWRILSEAETAMVTSGTATLETALFGVPQVVCYHVAAGPFVSLLRKWLLHVPFVSLVNLICGREAVRELVAGDMTPQTLRDGLAEILPGGHKREAVLAGYAELETKIGQPGAPDRCAEDIINKLNARSTTKD